MRHPAYKSTGYDARARNINGEVTPGAPFGPWVPLPQFMLAKWLAAVAKDPDTFEIRATPLVHKNANSN